MIARLMHGEDGKIAAADFSTRQIKITQDSSSLFCAEILHDVAIFVNKDCRVFIPAFMAILSPLAAAAGVH